nr:hypothetical protein [Mesorhizobium japonicum]
MGGGFGLYAVRRHHKRLGINLSFCMMHPVLSPRFGTRCGTNLSGSAETALRPLYRRSRKVPFRSAVSRPAASRVEDVLLVIMPIARPMSEWPTGTTIGHRDLEL